MRRLSRCLLVVFATAFLTGCSSPKAVSDFNNLPCERMTLVGLVAASSQAGAYTLIGAEGPELEIQKAGHLPLPRAGERVEVTVRPICTLALTPTGEEFTGGWVEEARRSAVAKRPRQ